MTIDAPPKTKDLIERSANVHEPRPLVENAETIAEILIERAARQSDEIAVVYLGLGTGEDEIRTYGRLDQEAKRIGGLLFYRHVAKEPEDTSARFILAYPPCVEFIEAYFGILYAGAEAVNVFAPESPKDAIKLKNIILRSAPSAILTHSRTAPAIRAVLQQDGLGHVEVLATDQITIQGSKFLDDAARLRSQTCFIQYTSGSTGNPKGVMIDHRNLLHNLLVLDRHMEGQNANRYLGLGWLPVFHDMGLIAGVNYPIYLGRPHVIFSHNAFAQRPQRWIELLSQYGATHTGAPNFGYDLCARFAKRVDKGAVDLSQLRFALCGAEPIRAGTLERFASEYAACGFTSASFAPAYGMAEATLMITGTLVGSGAVIVTANSNALSEGRYEAANTKVPVSTFSADVPSLALVASGKRCALQDVRVVDPDTARELPVDRIGEIWVCSDSVARGYREAERETDEVFHARLAGTDKSYLRTGDLGFIDGADNLFITGRTKDLIIVNGANHYPQDIEATIEQQHNPSIRRSVAFGNVKANGSEGLCILCELQSAKSEDELVNTSKAIANAIYKSNSVIVSELAFIRKGSVPRTTSGKIQRRLAREQYEQSEIEVFYTYHAMT